MTQRCSICGANYEGSICSVCGEIYLEKKQYNWINDTDKAIIALIILLAIIAIISKFLGN